MLYHSPVTRPATAEFPTQPLPPSREAAAPAPSRVRAGLLALAVAVAFADSSIVVLALPQLLGDFGTTIESVSWVVTSYNVAVAVLALALIPFVRRLDAARLTRWGLVVFCAACVGCAVADGLAVLIAARAVQGAGAAMLLAGSVPLLGALCGSPARGALLWGAAGVIGAAVGPALGGALTQAFDWRAIFIAQVPLAAAAIAATFRAPAPAREEPARERDPARPARWISGAALALISAALVGALFLAVVLMIDGWGHEPLLAAAVVSALPAGALAAAPIASRSATLVAVGGGILLVSGSLLAMALLPEPSLAMLGTALGLCGLGLGLSLPALTEASLRRAEPVVVRDLVGRHPARRAGARAGAPDAAARRRPVRGGGPRPPRGRLGADRGPALDPGQGCGRHRAGEGHRRGPARRGARPQQRRRGRRRPDLAGAGRPARQPAAGDLGRHHPRLPRRLHPVRDPGGARAAARRRDALEAARMTLRRAGHLAIAAALAALAVLIVVEIQRGAFTESALAVPDPCDRPVNVATDGLDGAAQRIGLRAIDIAACEMGTTREELLLSVATSLQESRDLPPGSEGAIRQGLEQAIDEEEDAGRLNTVAAWVLSQAAQNAPVEWVVRAVEEIGPILG